MSDAVIDKKTREQWMAEFTVWGASEGLDLGVCFVDGVAYFFNEVVEKMLLAYTVGRLHQAEAAACPEPAGDFALALVKHWAESYRGVLSDSEVEQYTKKYEAGGA